MLFFSAIERAICHGVATTRRRGKHTFRVSIKRVSKEAPKLYQAVSDVSGNVSACIAF